MRMKHVPVTWYIVTAFLTLAVSSSLLILWLCLTCEDLERVSAIVPTVIRSNTDAPPWRVLPHADYHPMPPYNFSYTINNEHTCSDSHVFLLIVAYTAPSDWRHRQVIRETWGNKALLSRLQSVLIFPLGQTTDSGLASRIRLESRRHDDIVQGDFLDSYRNLSYKGILMFKWASHFCPQARFLLKIDIDVFANTHAIVPFLQTRYSGESHFLGCKVHWRSTVLRPGDWCGKWCVTQTEYRPRFYPPYCWGSAYVVSGDLLQSVSRAACSLPVWWIADVYLTGIVPSILGGIKHIVLRDYMEEDPEYLMKRLTGPNGSVLFGFIRGVDDVRTAWNIVQKRYGDGH